MSLDMIAKFLSHLLKLLAMAFFFYASYQGVMEGGGSTSVFAGVGVLVLVLVGSYIIDKLGKVY